MQNFDIKNRVPKYFLEHVVSPACKNDQNIINAFKDVPRAAFLEQGMISKAYEDVALPIGMGQTISQVTTVAHMLYSLELKQSDTVLEIGAGSGFVTALLSKLVNRVYAIERIPQLMEKARKTIKSLRVTNAIIKTGDGSLGWEEFGPYDKIIASAGATKIPESLISQLKDGGILVLPLNGNLVKLSKVNGEIKSEVGPTCQFVDFVGS